MHIVKKLKNELGKFESSSKEISTQKFRKPELVYLRKGTLKREISPEEGKLKHKKCLTSSIYIK